jgi:AraC-like DNA-binding protein
MGARVPLNKVDGDESVRSTLTTALSGGFIVLAALLGLLAWRDARKELAGRLAAGLCLALVALEVTTGPIGATLPAWIWTPLRIVGGFNVGLLWLFCLAVLRDGFRLRRFETIGFMIFSIGPLATMQNWSAVPGAGPIVMLIAIAPFFAIGHIIWVAISEHGGDLVQGRQNARVWLVAILAAAALTSVASESFSDASAASLVRLGLASLPAIAIMSAWLTAIDTKRLRFEPPATAAAIAPTEASVDPRDQALLATLVKTMDAGLYRESGLTIERLAEELKTPTHRLRAVINQGLGHRNFASFVNGYRLAYAKAALADPARGRETVLAIAYESGFAALQTFNRVFKDAEGDTPTGFREKRLREAAQNQKSPLIS